MIDNFTTLAREAYAKKHTTQKDRFEREAIIKTLRECKFDIEEGSKWLGYSAKSLRHRMKELAVTITEVKGNGEGRKTVYAKQMFYFNKYDRAVLDDLVITWQNSCSTRHDECQKCPKNKEICYDITCKIVDKIYDKTGK